MAISVAIRQDIELVPESAGSDRALMRFSRKLLQNRIVVQLLAHPFRVRRDEAYFSLGRQ